MTRTHFLAAALLAAACGDVDERAECRTSAGCPVGEYCAHTADGSVCWPDAVLPAVGGVTVACGTAGCVRDGELVVTAEVTDDAEVYAVEATVDFDPEHPVALARGEGTTWTGTVQLGDLDFPALTRAAVVTVRALDGARNEASAVAEEGQRPEVTRVRWEYPAGAPLSPAAITVEGNVVVARSALSDQLLAVHPDGTKAWSLTLGTAGTVTQPPSIGAEAIWVGANDGKLYAVALDGSAELTARRCTATGAAKGPPAILTTGGVDVAFGAFSNGRIYASGPSCVPTGALSGTDPCTSGAVVTGGGNVYGVTSVALAATIHRIDWDGLAFTTSQGWSKPIGGEVVAPLALDESESVFTGGKDAKIVLTTLVGTSSTLTTEPLPGSIDDSPIILSDGDLVVGDASGKLHRIRSDGTAVWDPPIDLGAAVHAPMALADGPVRFLVATADGVVHALDDDGLEQWSGPLTAGLALGAGNLHTPAGSAFSTAYFGGADGKLYAVVVEGRLDGSAPWPKAWHDARNTSRAGP